MNSAPQSNPSTSPDNSGTDAARRLLDDVDGWSAQGWRLASPVWFPLLCTAITMSASVPAGILLDGANAVGLYWTVVAPLTALASGWFFATRRAQTPEATSMVVLLTGLVMLVGAIGLAWSHGEAWAEVAPWLMVGIGFGILAAAWRSATTAAVSGVCLLAAVVVAAAGPNDGYVILSLVVGGTAALAALVELVRADPGRSHG